MNRWNKCLTEGATRLTAVGKTLERTNSSNLYKGDFSIWFEMHEHEHFNETLYISLVEILSV